MSKDPDRSDGRLGADAVQSSGSTTGIPMAGDAPASVYKPTHERELHTIPPDGRPIAVQPAWRKDFPIDWPQDHYVARRDFTKFMVLTSLAFVAGQLWIGVQNAWRRHRGKLPVMKVASLDSIAIGQTVMFNYPGPHDPCILIRQGPGELLAYSQKCTHLSCAVVPRPQEHVIYCPCHHGYFDLESGRPIAGPPKRPLPRIELQVRGNDVYATAVEWRTT